MARSEAAKGWAAGGTVFAGVMMVLLGTWQVLQGIAAVAEDSFFVVADNYLYDIDTTAWGWTHIVLGALVAVAGFFVFTGQTWARAVGIAFAALSAIGNFLFLPYFPLWAIVMIGISVFVIWSLATSSGKATTYFDEQAQEAAATATKSDYRQASGGQQ